MARMDRYGLHATLSRLESMSMVFSERKRRVGLRTLAVMLILILSFRQMSQCVASGRAMRSRHDTVFPRRSFALSQHAYIGSLHHKLRLDYTKSTPLNRKQLIRIRTQLSCTVQVSLRCNKVKNYQQQTHAAVLPGSLFGSSSSTFSGVTLPLFSTSFAPLLLLLSRPQLILRLFCCFSFFTL